MPLLPGPSHRSRSPSSFPGEAVWCVQTKNPRKKVHKLSEFSPRTFIDGSRSTATGIKSDAPVSRRAYQDIRKMVSWNDARNIGVRLNSDAECPRLKHSLFSPIFSLAREKIGPPSIRQLQISDSNPSGAARQLLEGEPFHCGRAKKRKLCFGFFLRSMCYNNNENHY